MRLKHILILSGIVALTFIAFFYFQKKHQRVDDFESFSFPAIKKISYHKNDIDSLSGDSAVISFILKNSVVKKFSFFDTSNCEYKSSPWIKADFNNDGYTDLLVTGDTEYGDYVFAIEDSMGCKYKTQFIQQVFTNCVISKVHTIDRYNAVFVNYFSPGDNDTVQYFWHTNIYVHEFDGFIEYNPTPTNYSIQKVEFSTTPCYGDCPVFDMTMDEHGNLDCQYKKFEYKGNWPDLKNFKLVTKHSDISQEEYLYLSRLLNYTDFTIYKSGSFDELSRGDFPVHTLKITYDKNRVKTLVFVPNFDLPQGFLKIRNLFLKKYYGIRKQD